MINIIKNIVKKIIFWHLIMNYLNSKRLKLHYKNQFNKRKQIMENVRNGSVMDSLSNDEREHWLPRIELVKQSIDNDKINKHIDAGKFNEHNYFIMHNGLIIDPLSYYGLPMLDLLFKNKSIHEPQEEFAFQEILKSIPDSAVMVELGAYWSFYSMWFNSKINDATNYMIEPENTEFGRINFNINSLKGDFKQAYVSNLSIESVDENDIPTISIDDFVSEKKIEFIDVLHSDIQGFEFEMLKGASNLLDNMKVGYLFISTHSKELHEQCASFLESLGYLLVCSSDLEESYSWDGLLVFKNPEYKGIDKIDISKRKQ
jgi:hypothetical protein